MIVQYCTFYLGRDLFGVDILEVQEITRNLEITPIPHALSFVEGLVNLRGQIVVTVNLRTVFSMEGFPAESSPIQIILSMDRGPLCLLADRAGDVLDYGGDSIIPSPTPLDPRVAGLIAGVHKMENRLLHVLRPGALFPQAEQPSAANPDNYPSLETK